MQGMASPFQNTQQSSVIDLKDPEGGAEMAIIQRFPGLLCNNNWTISVHKVALIEDQEYVRDFIATALNGMCELVVFDSAKDFQRDIEGQSHRFDLVLTDIYLPGEDGREVLYSMMGNGTPIIIVTGDQDVSTESEMFSLGAFDYIRKPLNEEVLRHRVGLHLKLREEQLRVAQTQEQLVQSEKMAALGQLAAGVAHEINNPIGFVTSNSNLIKRYVSKINDTLTKLDEEAANDPNGEMLLMITRWKSQSKLDSFLNELVKISEESLEGLERIRDIVKDLKDYAHMGDQAFEPADLNKSLESTVNLLRNEIKYKAEVAMALGDLPWVPCRISQLNQVFVNILVNACHAIPNFGNIAIESMQEGDNALIRITDDGCGMPKEVSKHVFDPFFTTKPVGQGTGIGLAISKSIVDTHMGTISVQSVVGEGTTFEIRIPLQLSGETLLPT
nr:ATP-binding protein [Reinekea sp. G2M2-21]